MPKSRIPQIEIQIGGQTRHLIYGHHALGELEEAAAELPTRCVECGKGKETHVVRMNNSVAELACPWYVDGLPQHQTVYAAASRIKSVILAVWAGLLTETLDSRGRDTVKTLSRFQVAGLLDAMEPAEIEAIANRVLEAQGMARPLPDPTPASEPAPPSPLES